MTSRWRSCSDGTSRRTEGCIVEDEEISAARGGLGSRPISERFRVGLDALRRLTRHFPSSGFIIESPRRRREPHESESSIRTSRTRFRANRSLLSRHRSRDRAHTSPSLTARWLSSRVLRDRCVQSLAFRPVRATTTCDPLREIRFDEKSFDRCEKFSTAKFKLKILKNYVYVILKIKDIYSLCHFYLLFFSFVTKNEHTPRLSLEKIISEQNILCAIHNFYTRSELNKYCKYILEEKYL